MRKYRKARNFTQEQLSEKIGVSQKHLSIIETGTQFASASLIARISDELNVSPGDLFGGSSDELKNEIARRQDSVASMIMEELNHKFAVLSSEIGELREMIAKQS
ncbi:helix-turn-helix domain-containing protein [Treponema saccharophilum]|uniref:helix-turn-helix domain-containing protein n=1 Tax=Treponema saccharophilum TaxID=165 RepID=UPI0038655707